MICVQRARNLAAEARAGKLGPRAPWTLGQEAGEGEICRDTERSNEQSTAVRSSDDGSIGEKQSAEKMGKWELTSAAFFNNNDCCCCGWVPWSVGPIATLALFCSIVLFELASPPGVACAALQVRRTRLATASANHTRQVRRW
jgi:hypothetical protein